MGQLAHHVTGVAAKHGLTHPQLMLLRGLEEPRPMRDVAAEMCCDPSNVTGLIDRLEAHGLVERTPGSCDRRVKMLSLTAQGRALRRKIESELEQLLLPNGESKPSREAIHRVRLLLRGPAVASVVPLRSGAD